MAATTAAQARRHRLELVDRVHRASLTSEPAAVFATASPRLRRLVPFAAAAWVTTDPATGLPTGPTRLEGLGPVSAAQCSEHWRREFTAADVHLYRDLARAPVPAGGLRATLGDPWRSRRFRTFIEPLGFDDELRVVLRAGGAPWGTATLYRRRGEPAFDAAEVGLVAELSAPLGEALRVGARAASGGGATPVARTGPGLLLFDRSGTLLSADAAARAWLEEIPPDRAVPTGFGLAVPVWLLVLVFRAAGVATGDGDGTARARLRSRRGGWVVAHATCLRDADGSLGQVAVVLDAASPAQMAPIVVDAYDLTEREREVARHLALGAPTAEIARHLHLSVHTVRDHVKAILRKAEVSSRGELVAKLFAEHYEPAYRDDVERVG